MTCSPLTNDFEVLVRSRETVVEDINWEQGQLTEVLVVEHQHQRLMEERWNPATSAVKDVDDAMIDEMLKAIEEFDESHDLSEEDEAIIDALLEELDLENADHDTKREADGLSFLNWKEALYMAMVFTRC